MARTVVVERAVTGDGSPPWIDCSPACAPHREVVAVILEREGRIALLRRGSLVGSDRGLWHCVTGYVEPSTGPADQARREVREETGLVVETDQLHHLRVLPLHDEGQRLWLVHPFIVHSDTYRLRLNWEHTAYRWVKPHAVTRYRTVAWLSDVLDVTQVSCRGGSVGRTSGVVW